MRALTLLALLALAACSQEHELSPLQSAARRCKPSNVAQGEWPCRKAVEAADEPTYCYRTLGGIDCYARPQPSLSAETVRKPYRPEVTDPPYIPPR